MSEQLCLPDCGGRHSAAVICSVQVSTAELGHLDPVVGLACTRAMILLLVMIITVLILMMLLMICLLPEAEAWH